MRLRYIILALVNLYLIKANENWDNLKVTWGPSLLGSNSFASLPRTETEAKLKGSSFKDFLEERSII